MTIIGDYVVLNRAAPWYWRIWFKLPLVGVWARAKWDQRNTRRIISYDEETRTVTLDRPW